MKKQLAYRTHGTCSREIDVTLDENNVILEVRFVNGCMGNTAGISQLVRGMKAEDAIERLRGIQCGSKGTSCPDQLSYALEQCISK